MALRSGLGPPYHRLRPGGAPSAWPLGAEGRKLFAGTALYSAAGAQVGIGRATWITIAAMPDGDA